MSYRIVYHEMSIGPVSTEEFAAEHQALGRARELLETGERHGVAVRDHTGNELSGIRLQLKLDGSSRD